MVQPMKNVKFRGGFWQKYTFPLSSIFVDKTLKHFRCSFVICVKSTPLTLNNVSSNQSPLTESTENTDF